jgi:hypothetical protein
MLMKTYIIFVQVGIVTSFLTSELYRINKDALDTQQTTGKKCDFDAAQQLSKRQ